MPVPGSSQLILATAAHTWLFDRTTHQFTKHPRLGDVPRVKSVHIDTVTQRLLWIQGDGTTWWSDVLRFAHPETTIALPGEKVYKARWMPRRDSTRPPPRVTAPPVPLDECSRKLPLINGLTRAFVAWTGTVAAVAMFADGSLPLWP